MPLKGSKISEAEFKGTVRTAHVMLTHNTCKEFSINLLLFCPLLSYLF